MRKLLLKIMLVFFSFGISCNKANNSKVEENSKTDIKDTNTSVLKFVKLYEGRFAVKSDGSLWGWGGWSSYPDGFTTPQELLKGGIKDFMSGFVVKQDGTLWHMGPINQITFLAGTCGPYKGQSFNPKIVNNYNYKQLTSDANWVKVGVKSNGCIYNVVERPIFQFNWYDGANGCKGWHRNMEYWGTFWQIDNKFSDWTYTDAQGSVALRNNGILYEIAVYNSYLFPQYTESTYPDILKLIDNNVAEVLSNNGLLLYKKNDGTIWYKANSITQVTGNWKSLVAGASSRFVGVKADGTLWAWGYNADGFLGDGTYTNQTKPTKISDKTNWIEVSSADGQSFTALDSDGNIYGWGKNDRGQLGDGSKIDKYKPILTISAK